MVEFEQPTYDNFISLIFFLEELTGKTVDLVTSKGLSPYLSSAVKNVSESAQEKDLIKSHNKEEKRA